MADTPVTVPAIDYTARDFLTIREALKAHLQAKFPSDWKDFYASNVGNALMDLMCYCFTGDTKVSLVNGTEVPIKDLVGKGEFWVYAYDKQMQKIVPAKATARKTRDSAELVQVTLDNGEKIRCTKNHPFVCRDGSYRLAADLQPGDSLMPLYRKVTDEGLIGYERFQQPKDQKWYFTHRRFVGQIEASRKGLLVHHKDYNKRNNCPENLSWVTHEQHGLLHGGNPAALAKWARSPEGRANASKQGKRMIQLITTEGTPERERFMAAINSVAGKTIRSVNMKKLVALMRTEGTEVRARFLAAVRSAESRLHHSVMFTGAGNPNYGNTWCPEQKAFASTQKKLFWATEAGSVIKQMLSALRKGVPISEEHKQKISKGLKGKPKPEGFGKKISLALTGHSISLEAKKHLSEVMHERRSHGYFATIPAPVRVKMSIARKAWWQNKRLGDVGLQKVANHKVISVTQLDYQEPVYCLEVPGVRTFALSAGVFVGNCFDVLSFQLDYTANEMYLETARDRSSVLQLGRLVGYQLRTPTSAAVPCVATLPVTVLNPVVVAAGTAVKSVDGVDFVTVQQTVLQPGVTGQLVFVQGVNKNDTFSSDGTAFQKFALTNSPVVQDTIDVLVDGDVWEQVESLAYGESSSKIFAVQFDEDSVATIMFGDGISGKIPPPAVAIEVSYRTGGGIQGNIALNKISTSVTGNEQAPGNPPVVVTVVNSGERGSGGEDAETTTHAKLWIPKWIKANGRAVTEDDYDALGNAFADPNYGAPAFTKAYLKQSIPELNTVMVSVWVRDSQGTIVAPSTGLKTAISDYFNNDSTGAVKMICTHTEVEDGNIVYISISIRIKVSTDYLSSDVVTAVETAIENLFSSSENTPGADFRISKLYSTIQAVAGVDYCIITMIRASYSTSETIGIGNAGDVSFTSTLTLNPGASIVPGTVSVEYGTPATETLTDDEEGVLRNNAGVASGTIDYETGAITATFAAAPAVGVLVVATYQYTLDYQRGDLEATGDGVTTRFRGVVKYPPINPYDPVSGFNGIAFAAGSQVVTDDGNGSLIGAVDPTGRNVIDYDTGAYDFTFALPPGSGEEMRSTYRQVLETASQDIPIDKDQLAVGGVVNVETIT